MAVVTGTGAKVTSWGSGDQYADFITNLSETRWTLRIESDEFESTGLTAAPLEAATFAKGVKQWSGNITGLLATPATGAAGSVTYGSGYVVNAYVWDMTIEGDSYESTGFGDVTGSDDWLVFSPGPYQWGGSYGCYVDSSTSIPDADEAFSSATFAVDGSKTFAGSIATRLVSVGETNPRGLVPVNFEYRGSGLVTAAGSGNLFAAAAVDGPDAAASLVLQAASGKTYTGSAFWTRITIGPVGIRELSRFSIDFQGTGALTIA